MNLPVAPNSLASIKLNLPTQRGVYYAGKWHEPKCGRTTDQINPGTGESLGRVADCGADDIDAAVKVAKVAFKEWRRVPPLERAKMLKKIAEVLRNNAGELAMIDSADCGNPDRRDDHGRQHRGRAGRVLRRPGDRDERHIRSRWDRTDSTSRCASRSESSAASCRSTIPSCSSPARPRRRSPPAIPS